jgi:uncharacterized repeat protein (TIGR01451 family)
MALRSVLVLVLLAVSCGALAQSADQEVASVVDSPDPVVPGQNLTYTVTLRNNGPDPASNGGLNLSFDQNLTFQLASSVLPAGFTCSQLGSNVTCATPSFAPGTVTLTLGAQVAAHLVSFPDGTLTSQFSTSGVTPDPVPGNNAKGATTTFDSPQIDLALTVTDSPDPVGPDANITYTIPVTNNGPDTATAVNFNVFNNNTLRFQSATIPAGFGCTLPSVGGAPVFTCTRASFPSGETSIFTIVLRADDDVLGVNDGAVQVAFSVNGTGDDTNDPNNVETETTAYVTPDADLSVAVVDSPDPVGPDGNITYTATLAHAGPDAASNAVLNVYNNGTLRHVSTTAPAGFNCTAPASSGPQAFTCTAPTLAIGSYVFTIVMRAEDEVLGLNDGTVQTSFSVGSALSDPNNANNQEIESTAYVTPDANLSVAVVDAPDPVTVPDAFDYLVTIANAGPDSATGTALNVFNNGTLRFVSLDAPLAFSCNRPAVGAAPVFSCSTASFASGASAEFVLRVRAGEEQVPRAGLLASTAFSVGASGTADPVPANNQEIEETSVRSNLLLSDGFE